MRFASRTFVLLGLPFALVCGHGSSPERRGSGEPSARPARALSALPRQAVLPPRPQLTAAERRAACDFAAGATPAESLDLDELRGGEIPIDHFVIVMQENRSFDHY